MSLDANSAFTFAKFQNCLWGLTHYFTYNNFSPKNQGPQEINIIGNYPFYPQQKKHNPSMTQQLEDMDVDDFDTAPLT